MHKYLIVGLGNIGAEYDGTRHNIGFDALDYYCKVKDCTWQHERLAYHTSTKLKGNTIHLIKPTTYMNLSGKALKYWMDKEKIAIERILIIVDELALPLHSFRLRASGSAGGHNGLKDIEAQLHTNAYSRLRFGIGNLYPKGQQIDFVLGKWTATEMPIIQKKIEATATIIDKYITEGVQLTMNYCNQLKVNE